MTFDYKQIGFKCGIEIHQQLDTKKLFCNCPSIVHDEKADINILRRLRVAAGETGSIDKAAAYEVAKQRATLYEACSTSSCLVELDEEPPRSVNEEALEVALQVAHLLHAECVDEVQVMRKTVVDGSNVSGFQRTMLVAMDGYVDTEKGRVRVDSVCLEEESAKKVKTEDGQVTYRLDRLGIPLIEIATDASIKDPEHCQEVAAYLGMVLRSTKKVKRGIGTIRQDVNVSIKGHPRVEIKGFQDLKSIPKIIDYEIAREQKEVKKGKKIESHVRKAEPDMTTSFLRPMPGAARMYPETDVRPVTLKKEFLAELEVPTLLTERTAQLEKQYNLSAQLAREVVDNYAFEDAVSKFDVTPSFIARVLIEMPKEIEKRYKIATKKINRTHHHAIFRALEQEEITEEAVMEMLVDIAQGNGLDITRYKKASTKDIEKEIIQLIQKSKGLSPNAIMGQVMGKHRGKVDGKTVMALIKKNL